MILSILLIIPILRDKIKEQIKLILTNLKFNTIILYVTTIFLDLSFSLVSSILVIKNQKWQF